MNTKKNQLFVFNVSGEKSSPNQYNSKKVMHSILDISIHTEPYKKRLKSTVKDAFLTICS